MTAIKSLCVYCGASARGSRRHRDSAARLGRILAEAGIELVYGGGRVGVMGVIADAVMQAGGRVLGIIPDHLLKVEVAHTHVSELVVVDSMHARKEAMFRRADAFVILPGGLGTLDETFEILTWKQLRLHDKPVVICDLDGYWQPLLALIETTVRRGYTPAEARRFFVTVTRVEEVLPALAHEGAPKIPAQPRRL